jgi:6-phosphogluconolactonase
MTTLLLALFLAAGADTPTGDLVYIGTYTGAKSRGIYVARFDTATGRLTPPELAAESSNPSFLARHPDRALLYAANEVSDFEGQPAGSVSAFTIDAATGRLSLLNRVSSRGADPCHLVVDGTGKNVLVANYTGGSVASLPIRSDGSLSPASAFIQHRGSSLDPGRQKGPHAHAVQLDPPNRQLLVADLGLDQVLLYRFDAARGALEPSAPPFAPLRPGAGPRHLVFGRGGRHVYVVNEMDLTVRVFRYDAGRLVEEQTISTLPAGTKAGKDDSTAEIQVHPSGRFLYASNRGPDTIAVFAVDPGNGHLTPVEHVPTAGRSPRNFAIEPAGRYLLAANQKSDTVAVFRIDPDTGRLSPTGQTVEVGAPVCLTFVPLPPR